MTTMGLGGNDLLIGLMMLVPLVLSLTVHEWAHAYSAYLLGDDTAARHGRLTLNPVPHIDLIGTIILPLMQVPFGWAKPVPVNPLRFHRGVSMRGGMMITAIAGPLSNLLLAVVAAVVFGLLLRVGVLERAGGVADLLRVVVKLNIALCLFNFLPIPPLDGSRVADGLLPYSWRPLWDQYVRYSGFVLLGVLLLNAYVFHGALLNAPIGLILRPIQALVDVVAGRG